MQEIISAKGLRVGDRLREYILARIEHSFDRFRSNIRVISLRITDENGQRGGFDKRCKVQLQLRNGTHLVREYQDSEPALAVSEALTRAERALVAVFDRRRQRRQNLVENI